jgi:heme/copper-type cytochrome/quinol oxidase subunit 4
MSASDAVQARKIGRNVFIGLAAATVIEFVIATADVPGALILILASALFKAWLIIVYFMHVGQLRQGAD